MCTRGFSAYYSVDVVVRAFAEVKKAYPGAKLDLVGGGPLEADVRKLVADLKLSDVNFAGVASRDEIGKCYDQAGHFSSMLHGSTICRSPSSKLSLRGRRS